MRIFGKNCFGLAENSKNSCEMHKKRTTSQFTGKIVQQPSPHIFVYVKKYLSRSFLMKIVGNVRQKLHRDLLYKKNEGRRKYHPQ